LALRRHRGDLRVARRSVGRALLLCGGTAGGGFCSLGLSSNAGMASLRQGCAVGVAVDMLSSLVRLPVWWKRLAGSRPSADAPLRNPSSLYSARLWSAGLVVARALPPRFVGGLARSFAAVYWLLARHRREVVIENLLPVLCGDRLAA